MRDTNNTRVWQAKGDHIEVAQADTMGSNQTVYGALGLALDNVAEI